MKVSSRGGILGELRELFRVYRGRPPASVSAESRPRLAVILGAQVVRGGRPSPTLEARTRHAGELYARGRVDMLLPTGGEGEHPPGEAVVMSGILREMGVPEAAILREDAAANTWESALRVAEIARRRGVGEVLVVTDPLHCVRTISCCGRVGLRAVAEPVYSSPMWRKRWSRRGQFLRESGALVWYRIRYGVGAPSRR
ncbi:MAG: YdcF family protein [Actinomycetota bacterium]|nr:YdcF family protein [Actinomycetota bacterium]